MKVGNHLGQVFARGSIMKNAILVCVLAACGSSSGSHGDGGGNSHFDGNTGPAQTLGGCQMFPSNFIFNTAISSLPVDPNSAAYISSIGTGKLHLDLGTELDSTKSDYYGIPYNVANGSSFTWPD